MSYLEKAFTLALHPKARQSTALYFSLLLGMVISMAVSVINTRLLGPTAFGDYKFIQNLFLFVATCITPGIFYTGGRLLAFRKTKSEKESLFGVLLLIVGFLYILLVIGFWIFSFYQKYIFGNNLGWLIRLLLPFLFAYPLQACLQEVFKGDNKIYSLACLRIAPGLLYLISALVIIAISTLSLKVALLLNLSCLAISTILLSCFYGIRIRGLTQKARMLYYENKKFGFKLYIGVIAGVATTQMGGIIIAYYLGNLEVGFFSLGLTITMPLTMISTSIATTFFKSFVSYEMIPSKVMGITLILAFLNLIGFFILIKPVVLFLYGNDYLAIVPICNILAVASSIQGIGGFINTFLCARGFAELSRNASIVKGIATCIGFVLLIFYFGITGAAVSLVISNIGYLGILILYYTKLNKRQFA